MAVDWEPIIAGVAVVGGQVYQYFKNKEKTEKKIDAAAANITNAGFASSEAIVAQIKAIEKDLKNLSDQFHTMKVAFHAVDTSFKNTQTVVNNVSVQVDKQGRLLVEVVKKFQLSAKTVIPGENKS